MKKKHWATILAIIIFVCCTAEACVQDDGDGSGANLWFENGGCYSQYDGCEDDANMISTAVAP